MTSETITRNDLKAILDEVLLGLAVDYIVEEGTDGIWTYRKWNSGTYEAWGNYQATGMNLTKSSAGTYYDDSANKTISLPSWSKSCSGAWGKERVSQSSGVYIYSITPSATSLTVQYRAHASSSNAVCNGQFFVIGTWE